MFQPSAPRRRSALTLIELIIVLVVLVGLAGIIVPMFPSMFGRTSMATAATNIPEIAKNIMAYKNMMGQYPDRWDALTNETDLVDYVPFLATQLSADNLTSAEVDALNNSGIGNALFMGKTAASVRHVTFDPYSSYDGTGIPIVTTIDATKKLAFLNPIEADRIFAVSPTGRYLVLGLGKRNTALAKTIGEAPYHFGEGASDAPDVIYSRYVAVFKVSDSTLNMTRVSLIGVAALHPGTDGLYTANAHVEGYFKIANEDRK